MEAEGRPPTCHHLFPPSAVCYKFSSFKDLSSTVRQLLQKKRSFSEHLERFRLPEKEVSGFPRGLERPSPNQPHQIPQQEGSLLFSNLTLGK